MNPSRPSVHPVEAPPPLTARNVPRVRMKDIQGMPGTPGGLALRLCQLVFSLLSLTVMLTTSDFSIATAFRCLVFAVSLQSLWCFSLAIVDIYVLLVRRSLRNCRVVTCFTIGDGITSTLTFATASASAGITVLFGNDHSECKRFQTATAMAFISWFSVSPSFLLNFWTLASW